MTLDQWDEFDLQDLLRRHGAERGVCNGAVVRLHDLKGLRGRRDLEMEEPVVKEAEGIVGLEDERDQPDSVFLLLDFGVDVRDQRAVLLTHEPLYLYFVSGKRMAPTS